MGQGGKEVGEMGDAGTWGINIFPYSLVPFPFPNPHSLDIQSQINQAVRITPFVIVIRQNFHEVTIQYAGGI